MLQDLNARHVLEYKKTTEFLKYSLGNRVPAYVKNAPNQGNSVLSASMASASMMHN